MRTAFPWTKFPMSRQKRMKTKGDYTQRRFAEIVIPAHPYGQHALLLASAAIAGARMYAEAGGAPTESGIVEAADITLVPARMKRSGQRWGAVAKES